MINCKKCLYIFYFQNSELKLETQKLQRALMKDSSRECQVCRQKKLRKTEQAVQVNMDNKISMTGMSSGIVEVSLISIYYIFKNEKLVQTYINMNFCRIT